MDRDFQNPSRLNPMPCERGRVRQARQRYPEAGDFQYGGGCGGEVEGYHWRRGEDGVSCLSFCNEHLHHGKLFIYGLSAMVQNLPFLKQTFRSDAYEDHGSGPPAALSMSVVTPKAAISMTLHADDEPVRPALSKAVLKLGPL